MEARRSGAGRKNSSRFPPSTSDGLGGIPATVLFCHGTVADLANTALREQTPRLCTPHQLDQVSELTVPGLDSPITGHLDINHNRVVESKGALAYIDIFVDDFLGIT